MDLESRVSSLQSELDNATAISLSRKNQDPASWLTTAGPFVKLGAHLNEVTKWSWTPDSVLTHLPSWAKSQQRSVLSSLTERRYLPPGWNPNVLTQLSWPVSVLMQVPRASYTRIDLSLLPVAINCAVEFARGGFFSPTRASRCGFAAASASTAHSTTCS